MTNLFTKTTGTLTSYDSSSMTDSNAAWTVDQFVGWYVYFASENKSFLITSNTATKLVFENDLGLGVIDYEISFVARARLTEIESDASNTTLMSDDFLDKKYNLANHDISAKVFSYLRGQYTDDFDPLNNIKNLTSLQQVFCYFMLAKAYQDLSINQDSFESFKGYNMYEKSYNDGIKDALSNLRVDLNEDGNIDAEEIKNNNGSIKFLTR
jgi:hypothetical protein